MVIIHLSHSHLYLAWSYSLDVLLLKDWVELGLSDVSLSGPKGALIDGHINDKLAD